MNTTDGGDPATHDGTGAGSVSNVLATGAEATLTTTRFMGRSTVEKRRTPKRYRHPDLDARLRDERTRDEARLLAKARQAGVRVPVLYDVDRRGACMLLENVPGPTLRQQLQEDDEATARERMHGLGTQVARLHNHDITHGDLTTSNVIVSEGGLVLLDFGLAAATQEPEPRGVDLHLIEEALTATDERAKQLVEAFLEAYRGKARDAEATMRRLEAVRERGRYRNA